MEIHQRPSPAEGVVLLTLDGGLDHSNTKTFVDRIYGYLEEGHTRIVLDCEDLHYVSSLGLGTLLRVHHHFHVEGGRVAFANLHSAVAATLRVTRLDHLFDLYKTADEAAAALEADRESAAD